MGTNQPRKRGAIVSEKLKNCPFCDGLAEFERKGNARMSTIVRCRNCNCYLESGDEFDHESTWNYRKNEQAKQKRIEELEEAFTKLFKDECKQFCMNNKEDCDKCWRNELYSKTSIGRR